MKQISFSQVEYTGKKRLTRRDKFLAEMDRVVPWPRLLEALAPAYYPDSRGRRGRPAIALERMLRLYFIQQWYALADEALEDAVYDSQALRNFVGIDLAVESVPDATTLLKFRHLLEKHSLTQVIFQEINAHLKEKGLIMREGTLVDATLIAAAPSTKNRAKKRDPEMHQTKKGNQWYFGMKAHIGADAESGLVHSLTGTPANVSDINEAHKLLHGDEVVAFADAGYTGVAKRPEFNESAITWHVAEKRSKVEALPEGPYKEVMQKLEKVKAQVRARVEHPFHVVKNLFRHRKVRYRGLAKNIAQLYTLFALANLVMAKRDLREQCVLK